MFKFCKIFGILSRTCVYSFDFAGNWCQTAFYTVSAPSGTKIRGGAILYARLMRHEGA